MRIAHVCLAAFYIDGFGYQENILPRLHMRMGHVVRVIASTENYINGVERGYVQPGRYTGQDGVDVVRLPYVSWIPRPLQAKVRAYSGLMRELEDFKPDLIFVHDGQFYDFLRIRDYARANGCRVVSDCHTDYVNSARGFVSRRLLHGIYYRRIARACDSIVDTYFPTLPARADFLVDAYGLPRAKMRLLPFGVDDTATEHLDRASVRSEVRNQLGIAEDAFVMVTGGKLDTRKNIHTLIDRFSVLRAQAELQNVHLIVFGKPDAAVEQLLSPIVIDQNVHMLGWQKAADVYRLFWAADFAFFPGTHSVLWEEAIGHGLGAVFHRWAGMDHLDLGGNMLLIDDASAATLDSTLRDLVADDAALARRLSSVARKEGPKAFSFSEIAVRALS